MPAPAPQLSSEAAPPSGDDLARMVGHQAITLFVARSSGAIVGMLTLVTFPLPTGLRARIEDVVVVQAARGRGVGTARTMAALDLARQRGARSVDLTSRDSRVAANRLYQRLGFQLRDSTSSGTGPSAGVSPRHGGEHAGMRTAMLLVAAGQATVTVAAAWELLADRRRPPGQGRLSHHLLAFIA